MLNTKLFTISSLVLTSLAQTSTTFTPSPTSRAVQSKDTSTPVTFTTTKYITIAGQTNAYVTIPAKTIEIAIPTCIQTITPDKNGFVPPGTCGSLYEYYPSFGAALAFSIIFGSLTVAHITQAIVFKKKFCWVIIMGALWETIAFTIRTASTRSQQSASLVFASQLFSFLAPLWINAFVFMLLARLIHFYHPHRRLLSLPGFAHGIVFVVINIPTFIVQLVGVSYAVPNSGTRQEMLGMHIYAGGLGLQLIINCVCLFAIVRFRRELNGVANQVKKVLDRVMWTLYASMDFIAIRIIYRLIESSKGNPSSDLEVYLYIFEAVPMALAIACFNITHPGVYLEGDLSEMPGIRDIWRARKIDNGGNECHAGDIPHPGYTVNEGRNF